MTVKPKKHLGQHFLNDLSICQRIADGIIDDNTFKNILEIGPGMGALTQFLLTKKEFQTSVAEIDFESVEYLKENFKELNNRIHFVDFLRIEMNDIMGNEPFAVVGNFPYNISTQIVFKILENKNQIPQVVGMFQKEVAQRFAEKPGSKTYGITSVLLQCYYDVEYLFTVDEHVFTPPPKVKSGVIRLKRNQIEKLDCDEKFFIQIVKLAFNQRRKTLRNSLKSVIPDRNLTADPIFDLRPEKLSVSDFIRLSKLLNVEN